MNDIPVNDILPVDDILDVSERMIEWRLAYTQIQQQYQHGWTLNTINRVESQAAMVEAWELIDELKMTANRIEWQVERAAVLLKKTV